MQMEKHLQAYGWFLAFAVVTALVVRPLVKSMNIPVLKDVI
jgi:hypothetical protein